jgi:hypothetical protein
LEGSTYKAATVDCPARLFLVGRRHGRDCRCSRPARAGAQLTSIAVAALWRKWACIAKTDGQSICRPPTFFCQSIQKQFGPIDESAIAAILAKHEHNPMRPDDVTVVTTTISAVPASMILPQAGAGAQLMVTRALGVGVGWSGTADRAAIDRDERLLSRNCKKSLCWRARRHRQWRDTYFF